MSDSEGQFLPPPDWLIEQYQNGVDFTQYFLQSPDNRLPHKRKMLLYVFPGGGDEHGEVAWSYDGGVTRNGTPVISFSDVITGCEREVFQHPIAAGCNPDNCFSMIGQDIALDLEAPNAQVMAELFQILNQIANVEAEEGDDDFKDGAYPPMYELDDVLEHTEAVEFMLKGTSFTQYTQSGAHSHIFVWYNEEDHSFCWSYFPGSKQVHPDQRVSLDDISDVYLGRQTPLAQSEPVDGATPDCLMSIMTSGVAMPELLWEAESTLVLQTWINGLNFLLEDAGKQVCLDDENQTPTPNRYSYHAASSARGIPQVNQARQCGLISNPTTGPHRVDLSQGDTVFICRCGQSAKFPYCDASHVVHNRMHGTNYQPLAVSKIEHGNEVHICGCGRAAGRTRGAPFCDGSHLSIEGKQDKPKRLAPSSWGGTSGSAPAQSSPATEMAQRANLSSGGEAKQTLEMLKRGSSFTLLEQNQQGQIISIPIQLYLDESPSSRKGPRFIWHEVGQPDTVSDDNQIVLNEISEIFLGKQTPALNSIATADVSEGRALTFAINTGKQFDLIADTVELLTAWMVGINYMLTNAGMHIELQDSNRSSKNNRAVLGRRPNHRRSYSISRKAGKSDSLEPDVSARVAMMMEGRQFNVFEFISKKKKKARKKRVLLFYVPGVTGGVLHWCDPNGPRQHKSQASFHLASLKEVYLGKNTKVMQSKAAASAVDEHCFSLVTNDKIDLSLEADSTQVLMAWLQAIDALLTQRGHTVELDPEEAAEKKGVPHYPHGRARKFSVMSPKELSQHVVPQDTNQESSIAPDVEHTITMMERGHDFVAYDDYHGTRVPEKRKIFLFFDRHYIAPNGGAGCLYWCESGYREKLKECSLPLAQVTDVFIGKQTHVLTHPVAAKANPSRCFSILGDEHTHIDLEADSAHTLVAWLHGINTVLLKNANKGIVVDDDDPQAAADNDNALSRRFSVFTTTKESPNGPLLVMSPVADETIKMMEEGLHFASYEFADSNGAVEKQEVFVWLQGEVFYYSDDGKGKDSKSPRSLRVCDIHDIYVGKQTAAFTAGVAEKADPELCASFVGDFVQMNLEANSKEELSSWLTGVNHIIKTSGRQVVLTQEEKGKHQRSWSVQAREEGEELKTQEERGKIELSAEEVVKFMKEGRVVTLYVNEEESVVAHRAKMWYDNVHGGSSGELYVSRPDANGQDVVEAIHLSEISDVYVGKKSMELQSAAAEEASASRCFSLICDGESLHVEARTRAQLYAWLTGIKFLLSTSGATLVMDTKADGQQVQRFSVAGNKGAYHRMVTEGEIFTLYDESGSRDVYFFYTEAALGAGHFNWCPPGQKTVIPDQRIALVDAQHMYLGKQPNVFKSPHATRAEEKNSFSICTAGVNLNLEAKSKQIRKQWIDATYTILTTTGHKVVEEDTPGSAGGRGRSHSRSFSIINQDGSARPPALPNIDEGDEKADEEQAEWAPLAAMEDFQIVCTGTECIHHYRDDEGNNHTERTWVWFDPTIVPVGPCIFRCDPADVEMYKSHPDDLPESNVIVVMDQMELYDGNGSGVFAKNVDPNRCLSFFQTEQGPEAGFNLEFLSAKDVQDWVTAFDVLQNMEAPLPDGAQDLYDIIPHLAKLEEGAVVKNVLKNQIRDQHLWLDISEHGVARVRWANPENPHPHQSTHFNLNDLTGIQPGKTSRVLRKPQHASLPQDCCMAFRYRLPDDSDKKYSLNICTESPDVIESWVEAIPVVLAYVRGEDLSAYMDQKVEDTDANNISDEKKGYAEDELDTPTPLSLSTEEYIAMMTDGFSCQQLYESPDGKCHVKTVKLRYQQGVGKDHMGRFYWCLDSEEDASRSMDTADLTAVHLGKQAPVFQSRLGASMDAQRCLTLIGTINEIPGTSLHLEVRSVLYFSAVVSCLQAIYRSMGKSLDPEEGSKKRFVVNDFSLPSRVPQDPLAVMEQMSARRASLLAVSNSQTLAWMEKGDEFVLYGKKKTKPKTVNFYYDSNQLAGGELGRLCWSDPQTDVILKAVRIDSLVKLVLGPATKILRYATKKHGADPYTIFAMENENEEEFNFGVPSRLALSAWMFGINSILHSSGKAAYLEEDKPADAMQARRRTFSFIADPKKRKSANNDSALGSIQEEDDAVEMNSAGVFEEKGFADMDPKEARQKMRDGLEFVDIGHDRGGTVWLTLEKEGEDSYSVEPEDEIDDDDEDQLIELKEWSIRVTDGAAMNLIYPLSEISDIYTGRQTSVFHMAGGRVGPRLCVTVEGSQSRLSVASNQDGNATALVKSLTSILTKSADRKVVQSDGQPNEHSYLKRFSIFARQAEGQDPYHAPDALTRQSPSETMDMLRRRPSMMALPKDDTFRMMSAGRVFSGYGANRKGIIVKKLILLRWKRTSTSSVLFWCDAAGPRRQALSCTLDLRDIISVHVGKDTPVMNSVVARDAVAQNCFSLVTATRTLDLEAKTPELLSAWLFGITAAMAGLGRKVLLDQKYADQMSSIGRTDSRRYSVLQSSSRHIMAPDDAVQGLSAGAPRGDGMANNVLSLSFNETIRMMANGGSFRLYERGVGGQIGRREVFLYYAPRDGPLGTFYWCRPGTRTENKYQALQLTRLQSVQLKKTTELLLAPIAARVNPDLCFSFITQDRSVDLEANKMEVLSSWLFGLNAVMTGGGRRIVEDDPVGKGFKRYAIIDAHPSGLANTGGVIEDQSAPQRKRLQLDPQKLASLISGTKFTKYSDIRNPQAVLVYMDMGQKDDEDHSNDESATIFWDYTNVLQSKQYNSQRSIDLHKVTSILTGKQSNVLKQQARRLVDGRCFTIDYIDHNEEESEIHLVAETPAEADNWLHCLTKILKQTKEMEVDEQPDRNRRFSFHQLSSNKSTPETSPVTHKKKGHRRRVSFADEQGLGSVAEGKYDMDTIAEETNSDLQTDSMGLVPADEPVAKPFITSHNSEEDGFGFLTQADINRNLAILQRGAHCTAHSMKKGKNGAKPTPSKRGMFICYRQEMSTRTGLPSKVLYWCGSQYANAPESAPAIPGHARLPLTKITDLLVGKDGDGFDGVRKYLDGSKCLTLATKKKQLNLEMRTPADAEAWISSLAHLLRQAGKTVRVGDEVLPDGAGGTILRRRMCFLKALKAGQRYSSDLPALGGNYRSTRSFGTGYDAKPAPRVADKEYKTPSELPSSPSELMEQMRRRRPTLFSIPIDKTVQHLCEGQVWQFAFLENGYAETVRQRVFYKRPAFGDIGSGWLCWCALGAQNAPRSQMLELNEIEAIYLGKNTQILRKLANADPDRCVSFVINNGQTTLDFVADKVESLTSWLFGMNNILSKNSNKKVVADESSIRPTGSTQRPKRKFSIVASAVEAPALESLDLKEWGLDDLDDMFSPAAPLTSHTGNGYSSGHLANLSSGMSSSDFGDTTDFGSETDFDSALDLRRGTIFTKVSPDGDRQDVIVFFGQSGVSSGALYWCEPGYKIALPNQSINLNQIRDFFLGKQRGGFDDDDDSDCCITISGGRGAVLSLVCNTPDLRTQFLGAVQAILRRQGRTTQLSEGASFNPRSRRGAGRERQLSVVNFRKPSLVPDDPHDVLNSFASPGASSLLALPSQETINMMREGRTFIWWYKRKGKVYGKEVTLFYHETDRKTDANDVTHYYGGLYWCDPKYRASGRRKPTNSSRCLLLDDIAEVLLGKQTDIFDQAPEAPNNACFSLVKDNGEHLNFQVPSVELFSSWIFGLGVLLQGRHVELDAQTALPPSNAPSHKLTASLDLPIRTPVDNRRFSIYSNTGRNSLAASSIQREFQSKRSTGVTSEAAARLAAGQVFTCYDSGYSSLITVFYEKGYLYWCARGQRTKTRNQRVKLGEVTELYVGLSPAHIDQYGDNARGDKCIAIFAHGGNTILLLEARSVDALHQFLDDFESLLNDIDKHAEFDAEYEQKAKQGPPEHRASRKFSVIDQPSNQTRSQRSSITSNRSNASENDAKQANGNAGDLSSSLLAASSADSLSVLRAGRNFRLYSSEANGVSSYLVRVRWQQVEDDEGLGALVWSAADATVRMTNSIEHSRELKNISEITLGKVTPIFKAQGAMLAVNNRCFSLVSHDGSSIDLEAESPELLHAWIQGLNQIFERSDRSIKLIDENTTRVEADDGDFIDSSGNGEIEETRRKYSVVSNRSAAVSNNKAGHSRGPSRASQSRVTALGGSRASMSSQSSMRGRNNGRGSYMSNRSGSGSDDGTIDVDFDYEE